MHRHMGSFFLLHASISGGGGIDECRLKKAECQGLKYSMSFIYEK
jgi:hypothetical protein